MNNNFIGWMLVANAVVQIVVWALQRKLSRITDERIDIANQRIDSINDLAITASNTSVTHSKCCVQLLNGFNDLDKRLARLETDGK